MLTTTAVAWIDLLERDETVEGHYWTPNASLMTYAKSTPPVACPFCSTPMESVTAPNLGRIMLERPGTRTSRDMRTLAVVDLVPSTLEILSCPTCEMILTRPKEPSTR